MADLGSLVTSFGADLGPLKRSVMQAETQFHKFQKSGIDALGKVKKAVFSLQTVIGGLTFGVVIHDIVKTKNEFVKYQKTLETLEGSQKAANKKWQEMLQFAEETPFKINQVMESYKTLKAFGLDPTVETMRIMGDTAAALGGSDVMGRIALVLGQIQAQGFMTAQDMNQLANAGINAGKVMKDTFGVARDEVAKLGEQGINANMIIEALMKNMEEKFGGQMAKMNKELSGQWEMLLSIWQRFEVSIMNSGLYDFFTTSLAEINKKIIELRKTGKLDELAKGIADNISIVLIAIKWLVTDGINIAITSIKILAGWLIHRSFASFLAWASLATKGVGKLTAAVNLLRFSVKALGRAALYGLIVEGILQVVSEFKKMNKFVKETPAGWGAAMRLAMDNVINSFINSIIALGHSMHNIMRVITDPIIAAFTSFNILDLMFGDLTKEEAWVAITSSMKTAFSDALSRIGDDFQVDLSRRIIHIASEADKTLLQNWLEPPKPKTNGKAEAGANGKAGAETNDVNNINKTIDAYKGLIAELKFEKALLREDEVVQRAMTLARQNDIKIGSAQYNTIFKLVKAYDAEAQKIAEEKRIQEESLQSIQDFNAQYADLGKSRFDLERDRIKKQAEIWIQAAEATIKNEKELAAKKIQIAEFASKKIKETNEEEKSALEGLADKGKTVMETLREAVEGFGQDSARAITDFALHGKTSFSDMIDSMISDLVRMMVYQQITKPLFSSISGYFFGSAKGNVFQNGKVIPFVRGGVVAKPTVFPMANGVGLMGEAGPEAVLPLKRTSGGNLGVQASGGGTLVNIYNNVGANVTTSERKTSEGMQIDVVIDKAVAKKLSQFGSHSNRALRHNFGARTQLTGR